MKKLFILIISIIVSVSCVMAQKAAAVFPSNFKADINYMIPVKFESRSVDGYSMQVKDNNITVNLPYAGEAFSASMNSDGLNFTEPMKEVKQSTDKKGTVTLTFNVSHNGETYRFTVTAFDNNTLIVDVNPLSSSSISYRGEWSAM